MAAERKVPSRILQLPGKGRLFVCTDLHGNLADFRRMRTLWQRRREECPAYLLFTGDLIHGPNIAQEEWPDFMGSFFEDQSGQLMEEYLQLKREAPDQVFCLLGNHEHSHVGGPHTPKFWTDETEHFEQAVGEARARVYRAAFGEFPLIALTECGVLACHAAPNAEIVSRDEVDQLVYEGYEQLPVLAAYNASVLTRLIWSRTCPPQTAHRFLSTMSAGRRPALHVAVFGHDVVHEGFRRIGNEQLQLSTSFGLDDSAKRYLEIDLAGRYASVSSLREEIEIKRLYGGPD